MTALTSLSAPSWLCCDPGKQPLTVIYTLDQLSVQFLSVMSCGIGCCSFAFAFPEHPFSCVLPSARPFPPLEVGCVGWLLKL